MTKTTHQAAAAVLSAFMSLAMVAGMNGLASSQYVKAENLAMASYGPFEAPVQHVTVIGHRANA